MEDEELDGLALESTKIIGLEKFVPRSEIDERYLDSPYYLAPEDKVGQDAFAVIREAMRRKDMVGLGKVVISRRERIVMLEPLDNGLMATTLRYAYEVRDANPYFEDIPAVKLPDEMVELAEHILDTKAVPLREIAERAAKEGMSLLDYYGVIRGTLLKHLVQAGAINDRPALAALAGRAIDCLEAIGKLTES